MKRAVVLATVALLAMLILVRVAMAQGETTLLPSSASPGTGITFFGQGAGGNMGTTMVRGSASPIPSSGGSSIVLPAAALLLGSGMLTYAFLRRR